MSESVFLEAAGVRLHARLDAPERGEGDPVVVLHGFTGSTESMEGVAAPLARRRRVVRLDLVGHGRSDAPTDPACYAMAACCAQVRAAIAQLGLERPHLLGYSMGGRVALACAVDAPGRFASLIAVGATAGLADPALRDARVAADEALAERIERDGLERFVDDWMALPLFASQARLGPDALARARAQRLRNRRHGLANSLRGMGAGAQPPLHDRLDEVRLPVLLVAGEEDAKFRGIAAELAAALPDARVAEIPEAGHAAHLEAPEAFVETVERFLGEAEAPPSRPGDAFRATPSVSRSWGRAGGRGVSR